MASFKGPNKTSVRKFRSNCRGYGDVLGLSNVVKWLDCPQLAPYGVRSKILEPEDKHKQKPCGLGLTDQRTTQRIGSPSASAEIAHRGFLKASSPSTSPSHFFQTSSSALMRFARCIMNSYSRIRRSAPIIPPRVIPDNWMNLSMAQSFLALDCDQAITSRDLHLKLDRQ